MLEVIIGCGSPVCPRQIINEKLHPPCGNLARSIPEGQDKKFMRPIFLDRQIPFFYIYLAILKQVYNLGLDGNFAYECGCTPFMSCKGPFPKVGRAPLSIPVACTIRGLS